MNTQTLHLEQTLKTLGGRVTCHATFLKRGRKTFFVQSQASDAAGEPIAHATSTWQLLNRS